MTSAWTPGTPDIPVGTLLEFRDGEWRYGTGTMRLRVIQVREDLSRFYAGEIWLDGEQVDEDGKPLTRTQILARRVAINEAVRRGRAL
jgi:hypothetical protein